MGLYKRGSVWTIQYFASGKRGREAIGPSRRQAELVLAKRRADLREGRYFEAQKERPLTFAILAGRYTEEYAKNYKKIRSYQRNLVSAKALKQFFGEALIANITPEDVDRYSQERKMQGKANATINLDLGLSLTCSPGRTSASSRAITQCEGEESSRWLRRNAT